MPFEAANGSVGPELSSASLAITQRAREMQAHGRQVATLSIGDTHFPPPRRIRDALIQGIETGQTHYTSTQGLPELRQAIARYYGRAYRPEEIVVTPGVKQGLFSHLQFADYRRVCALEPAWLGYKALVKMCGMQYEGLSVHEENWLKRLEGLPFDALILCSPNNPDGRNLTREQLSRARDIVGRKGAVILLDEIYRHYLYDGSEHHAGMLHGDDRTIVLNGFSKSHAITGLRIGFVAAKNPAVIDGVLRSQQTVATCVNSLAQYGLIGFEEAMDEVAANAVYYRRNRDLIVDCFPELAPFRPEGALYYFIDLDVWGQRDGDEFCTRLLDEAGVALVPGSAYGKAFGRWARLSFSVDRDQLELGMTGLRSFVHGS